MSSLAPHATVQQEGRETSRDVSTPLLKDYWSRLQLLTASLHFMSLHRVLRVCVRTTPRLVRCNSTPASSSSQLEGLQQAQSERAKALVPLPPRLLPIDEDSVPRMTNRSRWGGTAFVLGIMPIFTFGLAVWQVQRLQWKVALIAEVDEKLTRDPIPMPPRVK